MNDALLLRAQLSKLPSRQTRRSLPPSWGDLRACYSVSSASTKGAAGAREVGRREGEGAVQPSAMGRGVFPQILSGKPKVYQGVRVKITVKELLQQRRARQAATSAAQVYTVLVLPTQEKVESGSAGRYLCDLEKARFLEQSASASSIPQKMKLSIATEAHGCVKSGARCQSWFSNDVNTKHAPFDAESISSVPNYCPSWQLSNYLSCEESPSSLEQLVDSCLQTDAPLDPAFSAFQTSSHYTSDAFQPVPLCFNQGLAAGSPSSADLSSSLNYSCSPPQLSPFTPLTHCPPSALDTKTYGCPAEEWAYHTPLPYPLPYFPCPGTDCMDYLPPMAMADDFFRRDRNCDICYS
nr:PREDICTED: colorectal cancer-associated protein 2 [Pelecanus crispus]